MQEGLYFFPSYFVDTIQLFPGLKCAKKKSESNLIFFLLSKFTCYFFFFFLQIPEQSLLLKLCLSLLYMSFSENDVII